MEKGLAIKKPVLFLEKIQKKSFIFTKYEKKYDIIDKTYFDADPERG